MPEIISLFFFPSASACIYRSIEIDPNILETVAKNTQQIPIEVYSSKKKKKKSSLLSLIQCESHLCETWLILTLTESYFELKIREEIWSLKFSFSFFFSLCEMKETA